VTRGAALSNRELAACSLLVYKHPMELIIKPVARKQISAMPRADAARMQAALQQITDAHPQRMPFVTEMVGRPGYWRARKGNWRAIYKLVDDTMIVESISLRKDAYQ
jgi:mRNA-degrading endonuclease RelE of RelBE toxin-antitoxin system